MTPSFSLGPRPVDLGRSVEEIAPYVVRRLLTSHAGPCPCHDASARGTRIDSTSPSAGAARPEAPPWDAHAATRHDSEARYRIRPRSSTVGLLSAIHFRGCAGRGNHGPETSDRWSHRTITGIDHQYRRDRLHIRRSLHKAQRVFSALRSAASRNADLLDSHPEQNRNSRPSRHRTCGGCQVQHHAAGHSGAPGTSVGRGNPATWCTRCTYHIFRRIPRG